MGPGSIARSVRSVLSYARGDTNGDAASIASGVGNRNDANSKDAGDTADSSSNASDDASDASSDASGSNDDVFVYFRVKDLPPTFYTTDAISSCYVGDDCHCYASHGGIVHLRKPTGEVIRTVRVHRASVLHIDAGGGYVATASIDGTVVIASIADPLDTVQASFRRPVHSVALHPDYPTHRAYVSGGTAGEVILSERSWLKTRKDTVLAKTNSTILAVAWAQTSPETRLIYCNEEGITIYCVETRTAVAQIQQQSSTRADLFRPRIHVNRSALQALISWGRTLYKIDLRRGTLLSKTELPYVLSGAVPWEGSTALLTVDPHNGSAELKLRTDGVETYADEIEPHARHKLGSNDFHLAVNKSRLYVVSSNDVITARERTPTDRVEWLLARNYFVEAFAEAANIQDGDQEHFRKIGLKALQQLVDRKQFEKAAKLMPEVLRDSDPEWLLLVLPFLKNDQHLLIGDVLPANTRVGSTHDDVLQFALEHNHADKMREWINKWSLDVYDASKLASELQQRYETLSNEALCAYGELLLKLSEFSRAALAFVRADSPRAFDIAMHYHLWSEESIVENIDKIIVSGGGDAEGNGQYVARLRELISARAEIPPAKVVRQLQLANNDLLLFGYLTELGLVDEQLLAQFADLMVQMYIRFDHSKLLPFLERCDTYDLHRTLKLCREDDRLVGELVYLLGRIGEYSEALRLMVTKLKDYKRATAFAASAANAGAGDDVWDLLISYCRTEPQLVLELLKRVEVSAARVLQVVPADMRISGLKGALINVFREQETSLELAKGARDIVASESRQYTRALRKKRAMGTVVADPEVAFSEVKPPVLVLGNGECVAVPQFSKPVTAFATKIQHLRAIL